MGGKAFAHHKPPLPTPRMPTSIYTFLINKYHNDLLPLYQNIATPLPSPEKITHGDIDILVCRPNCINLPLQHYLKAVACIQTPNSPTTSYAVPYPNSPGNYVQVDVHVCPKGLFEWTLFHQSHGDLWNILGTSLRPYGLTINDTGLHIRVPEIEWIDKKKSLVHLTSEPNSALLFFGLDEKAYWRGWNTINEMFAYATGMRFWTKDVYVKEDLKANDRKRLVQREIYKRFLEDWVPGMQTKEVVVTATRESVRDEALRVFGKEKEWEAVRMMWKAEKEEKDKRAVAREERKRIALEEGIYADAWIKVVKV